MKILYSHRIQSRDGQSVHIEEMVAAFRAEGHEVLVVGPSLYDRVDFGGETRLVATLRRMLPGALGELAELAYAAPAYAKLRSAYRRFRPDLVYERYNLFHLAGAALAREGALLYLEVNAPLAEERARYGGLQLARLARGVERATWRSAARVLAVTRVLGDMVSAAAHPRRVEVVPNGVVAERYPPRGEADPARPVVLGFVGFVRTWHGLDDVVAAIAADPAMQDAKLVVVGDGPARPLLEQQAASLGIAGQVEFTGTVPPERIPALVASFDVALQPRVTPYASPLKIFDYMAASCAIAAPDQANIREILRDGETALLFDPDTPGAMWQAVKRLATDPALRGRLGGAARAKVVAEHTWRGNAKRVVEWAQADLAARGKGV